jgi:superkiller protein 3
MTAIVLLSATVPVQPAWAEGEMLNYADYAQQANTAIERGDLTAAIQLLEKAMPLAPDQSKSVVLNNLAAIYMRRGNFYHNKQKQDALALADYRRAYYLLDLAWPEGMERKPLHAENLKIARDNLKIAYTNMGMNPADKALHLKQAKELRMQGKFQESLVEYDQVLAQDKNNGEALKAMGDLFNVLNQPEKSKKYYTNAVQALGSNAKDDVLVQLANAQNKSGQVNDAIANLNKALEINPNNTSALNQLEAIWKTELKFNPSSVLGHANLAGVYQKMKRYDEALAQYNAAEHFAQQDPKTPFEVKKLIRLNLGTLFQETKKYEQALNAYDTILQADRTNTLATYYKARLFRESGNTDEAIRWYQNLLTLDPNNENAHRDLMELITKQTDPAKAAAALKAYGDRFPENALVQSKVGEEFHRLKDYDNAATFYQRAIQLKPDMAAAHANLGAVYQAQGKEEESLAELRRAAELDPSNETVKSLAKDTQEATGFKHFQKAVELQQNGQHEASIDYFQKALAYTPSNHQIIAAYGIALQNTNRIPDAIDQYNKAIGLDEKNGNYHYYLGTAYHQNKQLDKALASYKQAVSLDGSLTDAKSAIALIEKQGAASKLDKAVEAYNRKQYAQALTLVSEALKADSTNATAYYYKGLILNEQKQVDGAITSYRQAIQHNPEFGDAYYALGLLLDTRKDTAGAKNAFQKFVELSNGPEDDFVKYAKQRLGAL